MIQKRYVIVKMIHESGQSYKMNWYYRDEVFGFTHNIALANKYLNKELAHYALKQIKEKGIYQIEKVYVKE